MSRSKGIAGTFIADTKRSLIKSYRLIIYGFFGLSGEEIPLYARIISVADVYDAMTSNRSYRVVLQQKEVRNEIERVSGSQLDPVIAKYMLELIDADVNYSMRQNINQQ